METINHNGALYVKASVLAKRFHYTSDYIGQLCRANKVDATLVGRAWFVNESSLVTHRIDHKKDTRPNEILSKNAHVIVRDDVTPITKVAVHPGLSKKTHRQFFTKEEMAPITHHWQNRAIAYGDDVTTLVPQMTNKIIHALSADLSETAPASKVNVELAGSQSLKVHEEKGTSKVVLQFTPLPEIPLSGTILIEDLDTESDFRDTKPVTLQDLPQIMPVQRAGVVLRYASEQAQLTARRPVAASFSVSPKNVVQKPLRAEPSSSPLPTKAKSEKAASIPQPDSSKRSLSVLLPLAILFAFGVSVLLVGTSSTLRTDGKTVNTSISLHPSSLESALISLSDQW